MFLYECNRKLTADRNEQFFYITGAEVDGVHVLDQKIEFAHQKRNMLSVVADNSDSSSRTQSRGGLQAARRS